MKRTLFFVAVLALLLAACAPQSTPTIDPAQVQASAVAAANTMVALTQAAIPTATPIPPTPIPTDTPVPSPTPMPLPTLANQTQPTPPSSGGSAGNPCQSPLDVAASGPKTTLLIRNNTKGLVTITIGISTKNAFGQCGYLSWSNIPKGDSIRVEVPQTGPGPCYWAYAWINDPKKTATVSGGGYCMNNADKWTMDIGYDLIKLTPP